MIEILDITYCPLTEMGQMASICWGSEGSMQIGIDCIDSGHHRVLEYVDMTLVVEGYSARMIRELYTHIIGTTRLQESTRYVDCSNFDFYVPGSIKENEEALNCYNRIMQDLQSCYETLQKLNIPKQDIANILPLGMRSKIVLKINLRALLHMAELRLCIRALEEYRDFMDELKIKLYSMNDAEWKYILDNYYKPKCEIIGYCNEKFTCGRMLKKENMIK